MRPRVGLTVYKMFIRCVNCRQLVTVSIDRGMQVEQIDWGNKPCVNCGTCRLDPKTIQPY